MGAILRVQPGDLLLFSLHYIQVSKFRYDVIDGHCKQRDVQGR